MQLRGAFDSDVAAVGHAGVTGEGQRGGAVGNASRVHVDRTAVGDRAVAIRRHHDAVGAVAVLLVDRNGDVAAVVHAGGAAQATRGRGDAAGAEDAVGADVAAVGDTDVRAFAIAGGIDAGRDLGAEVVGVVVGTVVVRVKARAGDDVAAVVDAGVAARLHLDAGGVARVNRDVAAIGQVHAAFAGGRVDAERLHAGRVTDHAVVILDLQEARGDDGDVAVVVDRRAVVALRLDAGRPGVAVDLDRAGVGHVDVRAGGEDAVGQAVVRDRGDVAAVVDADVAAHRVAVDADRIAVQRTGIDVAAVVDRNGAAAVGRGVDAARAQHDADGLDVAGVVDRDVAVERAGIDAQAFAHRDRADAAAGGGDRGAVVRGRDDAGGRVVGAGLDVAAVADAGIGAARQDAVSLAVIRVSGNRVAVVDRGGTVVGACEHAQCRAVVAVGVDHAAVRHGHVAGIGQAEDADRLAADRGRDLAVVVDQHVAVAADAEDAERGAAARAVGRVDRAFVADIDVAVAGLRADAVGAPGIDRDVAAVAGGGAFQAADVDAGADVLAGDVDVAAVAGVGAAVARERHDAVGAVVQERVGGDGNVARVGHAGVASEGQRHRAIRVAGRVDGDRGTGLVVDAGVAICGDHDAVGTIAVLVVLRDGDVAAVGDTGRTAQAAGGRGNAGRAVIALGGDVATVGDTDCGAFAIAGRVDAGADQAAVEGGVAGVVVVHRRQRAADDVAAVLDRDVAVGLRLDAGGDVALRLDVAAVGNGDVRAGGVDAERSTDVVHHRVDVAAVVDIGHAGGLRLDAGGPAVAIGIDRAGIGHVDIRAGSEDAVGEVVGGVHEDVGGVVDADVADRRVAVDADRIAVQRRGQQIRALVVGDADVAFAAVAADGGRAVIDADLVDGIDVVDHHVADIRHVDQGRVEFRRDFHPDRRGDGRQVVHRGEIERGAFDLQDLRLRHLVAGGEGATAGTKGQGHRRNGQRGAHRTGHGGQLDGAVALRLRRPAHVPDIAHLTPKVDS